MIFKKFALILCVLCPVIICSCDGYAEYTFVNKSSYTIQITMSEPYKELNSSDSPYIKSPFRVYKNEKKIIYIQKNDVDFTWTTNYVGDISKVYCDISGSKATFEDR
jgi:hypothetical protein